MIRKKGLMIIILIIMCNILIAGENPSKNEVWNESIELGKKWGVPPEIIFSICAVESDFKQFNKDGTTFVYRGESIGIMQIIPKWMDFDIDRELLCKDWRYNMEIGVRVLLDKWKMQYNKLGKNPRANMYIPVIGDGNRMVLESWYFALWAYNGWSRINNPHVRKNRARDSTTYQYKIYKTIKKEFGIDANYISNDKIETKGLPKPGLVIDYPKEVHYSVLVEKGYFDLAGNYVLKGNQNKYLSKQMEKYMEKID